MLQDFSSVIPKSAEIRAEERELLGLRECFPGVLLGCPLLKQDLVVLSDFDQFRFDLLDLSLCQLLLVDPLSAVKH